MAGTNVQQGCPRPLTSYQVPGRWRWNASQSFGRTWLFGGELCAHLIVNPWRATLRIGRHFSLLTAARANVGRRALPPRALGEQDRGPSEFVPEALGLGSEVLRLQVGIEAGRSLPAPPHTAQSCTLGGAAAFPISGEGPVAVVT